MIRSAPTCDGVTLDALETPDAPAPPTDTPPTKSATATTRKPRVKATRVWAGNDRRMSVDVVRFPLTAYCTDAAEFVMVKVVALLRANRVTPRKEGSSGRPFS